MLPNVGVPEILIVLAILLLLFGAKRIPDFARSIGSGVREFRKVSRFDEDNRTDEKKPAALNAAKTGEDRDAEPAVGGSVARETK